MTTTDQLAIELLAPPCDVLKMGSLVGKMNRKQAQAVCNALQAGRSRGNHKRNLVRRMARIYGNDDTPKSAALRGPKV